MRLERERERGEEINLQEKEASLIILYKIHALYLEEMVSA